MNKAQIIKQFTKSLVKENRRKNKVTTLGIINTLILSATNSCFVNESCKSSGQLSKSQVLYRKLENIEKNIIQKNFQTNTIKFLRLIKIFNRNRKFILSFDTTKEAFYGDFSKAYEPEFLHSGSIAKESYFYYEFLTVAITGNDKEKYILDGMIIKRGEYISNFVCEMLKWVKKELSLEVVLFDRGFASKELIYELNKLKVPYMIFWKKQGNWYKPHLEKLKDGKFKILSKKDKFYHKKYRYDIKFSFVIIKQLEFDKKKFDWIFATNIKLDKAENYVKRYKKRWGIETIYRVTDDLRAYTTSTKSIIRYFLFMFTCFVYNIWKFFQIFLGDKFTLSNFKTNIIIYLAKHSEVYPTQFDEFEEVALKFDL